MKSVSKLSTSQGCQVTREVHLGADGDLHVYLKGDVVFHTESGEVRVPAL